MRIARTALILISLAMAVSSGTARLLWAQSSLLRDSVWKRNGFATERFRISGTGGRNNPLRKQLAGPFSGDELFVRFRLRYDARSVDTVQDGNGEFFVLWLDQMEGAAGSTHSGGVPNIGLHVDGAKNRFMVRFAARAEKYGAEVEGDRDYLVVARLWKSTTGQRSPFDQLSLWVDPKPQAENQPDASVSSAKSVSNVNWIGFATGVKTEFDDRIDVWDIDAAASWESILELPKAESTDPSPKAPPVRTVAFLRDVLPILKTRCFECHAGADASEGIRLDLLDEVLNRISPHDADASRLFQLVEQGKMPPEGDPLNKKQMQVLKAWIDEGLDWDEQALPTPIPKTDHWAFQPLRRPQIPELENSRWVRTPVDAFIGRGHEKSGIQPAKPADGRTLKRRIFLDLLGLPPSSLPGLGVSADLTPSDIDKLLNHEAYGERWGRHWLDIARWAESNGHQHNRARKFAWRYRDWVIAAFNRDMPYDVFIRQQIAGDELKEYRDEHIVATGFLAAARYSGNELDKRIQRNDILVDVANTTAKAFLGLTLECAQCHTHKFDPLTIRDYYRFTAFFAQAQPANVVLGGENSAAKELIAERFRIFDSVHRRLVTVKRKQGHPQPIYVIPKSVVRGMRPDERTRFDALEKQIASLPQTWAFYSPVSASKNLPLAPLDMRWPLPRDPALLSKLQSKIYVRGDVDAPGPQVTPGWPRVFGDAQVDGKQPRSELARWLTSERNPLTARVWVNRIWQWHFGRGIVASSGDFGAQGAPPSHPELLDYLASELIDSGWSTRRIHHLILNSATYRQCSDFAERNYQTDPENALLWRWSPRRLEAEAIRDSLLAVSDLLVNQLGGPSVAADSFRRSVYLRQRRDDLPHQQLLFDSSNGIASCSRRRVSTNSLQPLWLLNSRLAQQAADGLANKAGNVGRAIELAQGRSGAPDEIAKLTRLAEQHGLASACLAILNSSEFVYLP